ncbi:hypothetical protein ACJA25_02045 [Mycoplasmopsis hyopharyngis]|uniref:hypothetical protein n=1 Tax=Mycoplasmopsis hyopharyngis TaxID=29558 RepID=UPI0038733C90
MAIKLIVCKDPNEIGFRIADFIVQNIRRKPNIVLGLCASDYSSYVYRSLIAQNYARNVDFSRTTVFSTAEYVGIDPRNRLSCRSFLFENLCGRINMNPNYLRTPIPYGNMVLNCSTFDNEIMRFGGLDISLLELGDYGELSYQYEFRSTFDSSSVCNISQENLVKNQYLFAGQMVPNRMISLGVGQIYASKAVILYAIGAKKANAVANLLLNPINNNFASSILQQHNNTYLFVDVAASSVFYQRLQSQKQQQMQQQYQQMNSQMSAQQMQQYQQLQQQQQNMPNSPINQYPNPNDPNKK